MPTPDYATLNLASLILVYVAGLATSLTPCIYPMIPIVIGYLGGVGGNRKIRVRSALLYVVGLSLIYALLGVVAAATGRMFGELTATPLVYLIFGLFILAQGGVMMDWYQFPSPKFLSASAVGENRVASFWHPLLVGASSGIVASPCTVPVMAGLLLYIATEREYFKGAVYMLAFSAGINTLLLVLGICAGLVGTLPRSGKWMVVVKKLLACLLLAGGLYFIYRAGQIS